MKGEERCLTGVKDIYTIDFKIFAVERGMGFSHEIEIWNGEIREDRSNSYETYGMFLWKCPFPELGG